MLGGYKIGDSACFACAMSCGNICLVKQGKYVGTVTEGPEYESCAMLGSNLGVDNFAAVLHANQLCDELGMDTISTGSLIGAVIEGYEKGILSLEDLDGQPITWGDDDADPRADPQDRPPRRASATRWPTAPAASSAAGRKWTS